jgi:CheY-like chemotaxis protein
MERISKACVIDDDKIFQFSAKRLLEATGLVDQILQFPDGEIAWEYFILNKNNPEELPDLVFLDLNMPYLDGWGFLKRFTGTKFKKKLITIYISTSSDNKQDREWFNAFPKLKGYLLKPISKASFKDIIGKELGSLDI